VRSCGMGLGLFVDCGIVVVFCGLWQKRGGRMVTIHSGANVHVRSGACEQEADTVTDG
jgi:hypothetical protein